MLIGLQRFTRILLKPNSDDVGFKTNENLINYFANVLNIHSLCVTYSLNDMNYQTFTWKLNEQIVQKMFFRPFFFLDENFQLNIDLIIYSMQFNEQNVELNLNGKLISSHSLKRVWPLGMEATFSYWLYKMQNRTYSMHAIFIAFDILSLGMKLLAKL